MFGVVEVLQYFWILKSLRTKNYFQFFIMGCCCCFCCWGCCCCYCAQFELFVGFVQNCYIWHIPMNCWDHGWSVQGLLFSQYIEDGQCPNIRYIHIDLEVPLAFQPLFLATLVYWTSHLSCRWSSGRIPEVEGVDIDAFHKFVSFCPVLRTLSYLYNKRIACSLLLSRPHKFYNVPSSVCYQIAFFYPDFSQFFPGNRRISWKYYQHFQSGHRLVSLDLNHHLVPENW